MLGGLTGGMSIHGKDQRHKLKIIPFELHRRIQAFGTLGTHYATVVGGPAIEYGSHGQCQVTGGHEGLATLGGWENQDQSRRRRCKEVED